MMAYNFSNITFKKTKDVYLESVLDVHVLCFDPFFHS